MRDPRVRSPKAHRTFLQSLAAQVANPQAGFFGPGSMAWRINREMLLGLVVLRALFMQVAHPKVAQGVGEHSDFRRRPFGRALATLKSQQQIVFGTCQQSIEALMRIYARHTVVRGQVPGEGDYEANDPDLLLWVFATLIDSMLYAYRTFIPDLSLEEWELFYDEALLFGRLIGIPDGVAPPTLPAFEAYMAEMLSKGTIEVTPIGREIGRSLLGLPLRLAWPITAALTAGTLPASLRRQFGLPWSAARQRYFNWGSRLIRGALRYRPLTLHTSPVYWLALRRTRSVTRS